MTIMETRPSTAETAPEMQLMLGALVQLRKGSGAPFRLLPGLILHDESGTYTADADAILRGKAALALGVPRL